MLGFWLALLLTAALSGASAVPGAAGRAVGDALRAQAGPSARIVARIEGDPLLELPCGKIPRLEAELDGARFGRLPVSQARLALTGLRLEPGALWLSRRAVLAAPAEASLALTLTLSDLQAGAEALFAPGGPLADASVTLSLFGRPVEASLALAEPRVRIAGERLELTGLARLGALALPLTVSAGLAVSPDGRGLALVKPALALRGTPLPESLVTRSLGALGTTLPLAALGPEAEGLRLARVSLSPEGLRLTAEGTVDRLPVPR